MSGSQLLAALREKRFEAIEAARSERDVAQEAMAQLIEWGPTRLRKPPPKGTRTLVPQARESARVIHPYEWEAELPICGRTPDGSSAIVYKPNNPGLPYLFTWCDHCHEIEMKEIEAWVRVKVRVTDAPAGAGRSPNTVTSGTCSPAAYLR